MSTNSIKLQQRASLMSILNKYRSAKELNNAQLRKDIELISTFKDKKTVCKTLFQEITNSKELFSNICSIIALEVIDKDVFEEVAIKFLQNKNIEDERKIYIVTLLKEKGSEVDYEFISQYISNPDDVVQGEIGDFFLNAIDNPEVQIDLLDFYINISKEEKIQFLNNLISEYKDEISANIFNLLVQLELEQEELEIIISGLLKSNSSFAIEALEYIYSNYELEAKLKSKLKRKINKLKLSIGEFKNNHLIKNSTPFKSFAGFVDGQSNFSLLFSRLIDKNKLDALFVVININTGAASVMGFGSVSHKDFKSIVKRLFSDSVPVSLEHSVLKSLFVHYCEKSRKNNIKLPYELIVWKKLLDDIEELKEDLSQYLNKDLIRVKLDENKVKKVCSAKMLETWYYSVNQNNDIDDLFDVLERKHTTNLDEINEIVSKFVDDKFMNNQAFLEELKNRLLLSAYFSSCAKLKGISSLFYSLCFDNPYTKLFITSMVDKSIYYNFSTKAFQLEEKENVFNKKLETNYSQEELELVMSQLEAKWT